MRKIIFLLTMSILLVAFDMNSYMKELQNKIKNNNSKFDFINYGKKKLMMKSILITH